MPSVANCFRIAHNQRLLRHGLQRIHGVSCPAAGLRPRDFAWEQDSHYCQSLGSTMCNIKTSRAARLLRYEHPRGPRLGLRGARQANGAQSAARSRSERKEKRPKAVPRTQQKHPRTGDSAQGRCPKKERLRKTKHECSGRWTRRRGRERKVRTCRNPSRRHTAKGGGQPQQRARKQASQKQNSQPQS